MPKITYVEHNGTEHLVELAEGLSVMQGAVHNNVPGIDADCGGECACATCHVYVDPSWLEIVGARNPVEDGMLAFASAAKPNSRLACQIKVTERLDGLVVRLPDGQH
jgi:2Fe-2S ferredoxin